MKKQLIGPDVSIEISLKEYGFAWEEFEEEFRFWYGIHHNGDSYDRFDWVDVPVNLDVRKEYNWVDWEDVEDYYGQKIDDMELVEVVQTLFDYYGYENVFGSSYTTGHTYGDVTL